MTLDLLYLFRFHFEKKCIHFEFFFFFLVVPKVKKKSHYPKTPIERTRRLRNFKKMVGDVLMHTWGQKPVFSFYGGTPQTSGSLPEGEV